MKSKLLITGALCAIAFTTNAQTEKGKKLLGGSIGFVTQKAESFNKNSSTSLNIGPQIGFFIAENLVIGTSLNYSYSKTKPVISNYFDGSNYYVNSISGNLSNSYGITPYVRYYINIIEKLKFYGQFNVGANFGTQQMIDAQSSAKTKTNDFQLYNTSINPGLAFFATKKLAIELSFPLIGYMYQNYDEVDSNPDKSTFSAFTFAASTSPSVGVNFHF